MIWCASSAYRLSLPRAVSTASSANVLCQQSGDVADPVESPQIPDQSLGIWKLSPAAQLPADLHEVVIRRSGSLIHPGVHGVVVNVEVFGQALQREPGLAAYLVQI